jgi:GTPase-activator protein for Ras-like GTPase
LLSNEGVRIDTMLPAGRGESEANSSMRVLPARSSSTTLFGTLKRGAVKQIIPLSQIAELCNREFYMGNNTEGVSFRTIQNYDDPLVFALVQDIPHLDNPDAESVRRVQFLRTPGGKSDLCNWLLSIASLCQMQQLSYKMSRIARNSLLGCAFVLEQEIFGGGVVECPNGDQWQYSGSGELKLFAQGTGTAAASDSNDNVDMKFVWTGQKLVAADSSLGWANATWDGLVLEWRHLSGGVPAYVFLWNSSLMEFLPAAAGRASDLLQLPWSFQEGVLCPSSGRGADEKQLSDLEKQAHTYTLKGAVPPEVVLCLPLLYTSQQLHKKFDELASFLMFGGPGHPAEDHNDRDVQAPEAMATVVAAVAAASSSYYPDFVSRLVMCMEFARASECAARRAYEEQLTRHRQRVQLMTRMNRPAPDDSSLPDPPSDDEAAFAVRLLDAFIDLELQTGNGIQTLMRGNSATTRLLQQFGNQLCAAWLGGLIAPLLITCATCPMELDPEKIPPEETQHYRGVSEVEDGVEGAPAVDPDQLSAIIDRNGQNLVRAVDDVLELMDATLSQLPRPIFDISQALATKVSDKFGSQHSLRGVSTWFFLRVVTGAIVDPTRAGLPAADVGIRSPLFSVAKVLQIVANGLTFAPESKNYPVLNPHLPALFPKARDILIRLSRGWRHVQADDAVSRAGALPGVSWMPAETAVSKQAWFESMDAMHSVLVEESALLHTHAEQASDEKSTDVVQSFATLVETPPFSAVVDSRT